MILLLIIVEGAGGTQVPIALIFVASAGGAQAPVVLSLHDLAPGGVFRSCQIRLVERWCM